MARYKREISIEEAEKRLKKGWGVGVGADYHPFLTVQDVPSRGESTRIRSFTCGRKHEVLSKLEKQCFFHHEWSDSIVDIREQFPLDWNTTLEIARQIGVKHPTIPHTTKTAIMTTDFLITYDNGYELAINVKYSNDIRVREIEKFEIERIYWQLKGVGWRVFSDKNVLKELVHNVAWAHQPFDLEEYNVPVLIEGQIRQLLEPQVMHRERPLSTLTSMCDDRIGIEPGTSLLVVRHLIITKKWIVRMDESINPDVPLSIVEFVPQTDVKIS